LLFIAFSSEVDTGSPKNASNTKIRLPPHGIRDVT
jgi:hypothetical protein